MPVAIVTGGTFGIGQAISLTLAARGHAVVAFGLDAKQMTSTAEGGSALLRAAARARGLELDILDADVANAADVARVCAFALEKFGRIDGLVNNAAIAPNGTILETSEGTWDRVLDVNLKGMFLCCKAVVPHMIAAGGGRIVNVGSGSGYGRPNNLAYAASKGGVHAFSTALAYDHFHDHIRVNVVVPGGGLVTGITLGRVGGDPARLIGKTAGTVAGRDATGEDIARAVAFLLSPDADAMTGAVVNVGCFDHQGGMVLPKP